MGQFMIYLSSPPEFVREAGFFGPAAAMGWRVGRGLRLTGPGRRVTGAEIVDVDMAGVSGYGPHEALASALVRECRRVGAGGLSLDLPRPTAPLTALAGVIARRARDAGIRLYLPLPWAGACPEAHIVLPAQNLSGTYDGRLRRLAQSFGAGRLAPELERVSLDFPLPSRAGRGTALSPGALREAGGGPEFYSPELRTNYFSYVRDGRAHLVLRDGPETLSEKLLCAARLGVREAFVYYPHVRDIAEELVTFASSL